MSRDRIPNQVLENYLSGKLGPEEREDVDKRLKRDRDARNRLQKLKRADEDAQQRQQSSETAKKMIEHFEKRSRKYENDGGGDGTARLPTALIIIVLIALAIVAGLVLVFVKKPF